MPRGVPNAKRDDVPMRFTMFHIPPQMNQKQGGSHYLKSEEQTLWGRNKRSAKNQASEGTLPSEARRGSNVIVIHPGTRFLRIGRASDVFPVAVPHVIARKSKVPLPPPTHVSVIAGKPPGYGRRKKSGKDEDGMDVDEEPRETWDPIDPKTSPIISSLRERMLFYKLHIVPNAAAACITFNGQIQPEIIPDHNDPYRVDWVSRRASDDVIVGEKVLRLADPHSLGYTVRWPFHGSRFNSFDYEDAGPQALLNDIETIWRTVLQDSLKIDKKAYKDYSVVLIVPDLFERPYVRELANMLLVQMGFKQLCLQQESISATYGAGISSACVIDAGAAKTSVAIVDEGLVLPDSRISLNMGGDDITEYLLALLQRIQFPYREIDLARFYDWSLIEDLKAKICTLAEVDVALNFYDFVIRRPGKPTEKYGLRAYNEVILAPMCMFEPRVIEFEHKLVYTRPLWSTEVGEEIVEQVNGEITQAMIISTQHLLPPALPVLASLPPPLPHLIPPLAASISALELDPVSEIGSGRPVFSVAPQTVQGDDVAAAPPPQVGSFSGRTTSKFISLDASNFESGPAAGQESSSSSAGRAGSGDQDRRRQPSQQQSQQQQQQQPPPPPPPPPPAPSEAGGSRPTDGEPSRETEASTDGRQQGESQRVYAQPGAYPGGYGIPVAFEAGKLPLDVAIFNSARAAGGDEKIRKYLQAVLVVGGSALVQGMAHALESRLQAIASPLVPNMEKVQIIPPPRDVDPRVLCWKGGAVLGKMDAVADLWVLRSDWDILGMRALKERSFFL